MNAAAASAVSAAVTAAPDGKDVESQIAAQLGYLSKLARHLGIADPVEEFFAPVVGRWSDLHAEADRWRLVGEGAEQVTEALGKPLGKLDAAWDGAAADSFIAYMQKVGLAGNDLADAMVAMADVLDKTANGIREIVVQLATVMAETAETASEAMSLPVQGDDRTREYLDLMRRPTKELFESVRQVLEAFVQLCEGTEGTDAFEQVRMAHTFPENNWSAPQPPAPPAPPAATEKSDPAPGVPGGPDGAGGGVGGGAGGGGTASPASPPPPLAPGNSTFGAEQLPKAEPPPTTAAAASAPKGGGTGAGMPMMPFMPMGGAQGGQGGDGEHKPRNRLTSKPSEIFGTPKKASTPVIGADDD